MTTSLAPYIETIARRLLGEPNRKAFPCRDEWRYGTKGSLSIQMTGEKQGEWFDHEREIGGGPFTFIKEYARVDDEGARKWIADELGLKDNRGGAAPIVFNYIDENGALLFQVCKQTHPKKMFWQRQPDSNGGWKRGEDGKLTMQGARYVPYHLDRLVAAKQKANGNPPRVFICEGEKDADNVWGLGFLATTNAGGASTNRGKSKWREEYNQYFAGFDAVLLPDNDEAGRVHAQHVAANLAPVAHAVRILKLPGLTEKGADVTDWINAAKATGLATAVDLGHLIKAIGDDLTALVEATPLWVPTDPPPPPKENHLEEALRRLNDRYFVLSEAGKVVIGEWRADNTFEIQREVLDRFTFADFRKLYLNQWIAIRHDDGTIERKNLAEWWLRHPRRRQYDGVVFDPSGKTPKGYLNLWRGFGVDPAPGDWSLMREHILRVICRGDPVRNEYFLNWMARMVQHPEEPGEVALVTRSDEEGTGKGILGRYICRMFGQHALHITHAPHLTGRFNDHLQDCVFLFADEAFFAGDKVHGDILKGLITEYELTIEGKYRAVVTARNRLHILIVSNRDWVVPASITARRFVITEALDTHRGDRAYFTNIVKQMDNGGLAAMLHDLLQRPIADFDFRAIPDTAELREQKALSLPSLDRWWLTVLDRGYLWQSRHGAPWFIEWHEFYTTELLTNSYLQWCNANRPFDRKNREQLGAFFKDIYKPSRPQDAHPVHEIDSIERGRTKAFAGPNGSVTVVSAPLDELAIVLKKHPRGYQVGDLEAARARYADMREGIDVPWKNDPGE
jgi:hypothetical protein